MISICIPVYNFYIYKLVDELSEQGHKSGVPFEIVIIDDGSAVEYREQNSEICKSHKYIELGRNVGRSKIRNLFAGYSKYENLLFVDCDSEIISDKFIKNYITELQYIRSQVICGGTIYTKNPPPVKMRLRWIYGIKRESLPASVREESPFRYFMTNNFLINRKVMEVVKFDERLVSYGYEDTLFAYKLMQCGFLVKHTDNPVLHSCGESNPGFLRKTEQSIINLGNIVHYTGHDENFIQTIRILRVSSRIEKLHLSDIFGFFFSIVKPYIRLLLERGSTRLFFLDIYKLGLLILFNRK